MCDKYKYICCVDLNVFQPIYLAGLQPVRNPARCQTPPSFPSRVSLHHYQLEHMEGLVRNITHALSLITSKKVKAVHTAYLCQLKASLIT